MSEGQRNLLLLQYPSFMTASNADERTLPIRDYTAGLRVTCPGAPQDSVSCSKERRKLYPVEKNLSVASYTSSVTLCLGSSKISTSIH